MSLNTNNLLRPRETIENFNTQFESVHLDTDQIFGKVIKMDIQKRILMNAIYSKSPTNLIFVGPPGCGKTLLLESIKEAFPSNSLLVHSHTSSGIGTIEAILQMGQAKLRFLLIDEIERFSKRDRQAFLSLIEGGKISRRLQNRNVYEEGFKVYMFATCNDIEKMRREERHLVNRCSTVNVPELSDEDYLFVASKRLLREPGIESEEISSYIAKRVLMDFGVKDMRLALRLAHFAESHAARTKQGAVTKDIVDAIAIDFKLTAVPLTE